MTFYLVWIGIVMFLFTADYLHQREKYGILTVFALWLVGVFVIFRHEVGYDYQNYISFYQDPLSLTVQRGLEWGFVAIIAFLQATGLDVFWLFCFFGIAILSVVFRGIRLYTPNVRIAFLIYLLVPGLFLNSMSILRQALAIVLIFNAYYYLYNKRYRRFWLWFVLGALFHYSVLAILPFLWVAPKLADRVRLILLIGIPVSLVLSQVGVIGLVFNVLLGSSKFAAYAGFEDGGTSFAKLLVLNGALLPYLFFYKRMDRMNRSMLVLLVFGLMLLNVFSSVGAITRISYYFRIFEIVLVANILPKFKVGISRTTATIVVVLYFFVMFCSSLAFDYRSVTSYPKLTPYKTIFNS